MAEITLANGGIALVDDSDVQMLLQYNWRRDNRGYAVANVGRGRGKPTIKMHRFIMRANPGEIVDHRSGDGLNNRRGNLRICTGTENIRNRKTHKNNQLGIKGVYLDCREGRKDKYVAQIVVDKKRIRLGRFDNSEDAAKAYRVASIKYHGEFSVFMPQSEARYATR